MNEDLQGRLLRLSSEVESQALAVERARGEVRRLATALGNLPADRLDADDRSPGADEQCGGPMSRRAFARYGGFFAVGAATGLAALSQDPASAAAAPHPFLVASHEPAEMTPATATAPTSIFNAFSYGAVADGSTNNTAALQKMLNAAAHKGIAYIPAASKPFCTKGLTAPSGTHLILDGTLQALSGTTQLIAIEGGSNTIVIEGMGTLDGDSYTADHGIYVYGTSSSICSYLKVRGLTVQGMAYFPISVLASTNVYVTECALMNSKHASQFADGCSNCWASRCYCANIPDYGFALYGGAAACGITDCTADGCAPGFGVLNDSGQPAICSDVLIANCISRNSNGQPNFIVATNGGDGLNTQVTITNNVSVNGGGGGYNLTGLGSGVVANNLSNNDSGWGFDLGAASMDFVFSGNIAQGTTAGLTGGPNNSCMLIGNFVPGSNYNLTGINCFYGQYNEPQPI
jgi:hypothetical protein